MSKFVKNCAYCNQEYKGRIDSLFCSTSCRTNHWRRNKKALNGFTLEDVKKPGTKSVRKLYLADKGIGMGEGVPSIVTCFQCQEKGKIGLFYFGYMNKYIRCDGCGLTFERKG